jgi:hypothetical protein
MSATESELRQLNQLRHGLLALHKTLLDAERRRYEREHGRVEDGGPMLQLLAYDPSFAWLRVFSAFIVQIDERVDDKEHPITSDQAKQLLAEARGLLAGHEGSEEFQRNLAQALQDHPDVVIAHSKALQGLASGGR